MTTIEVTPQEGAFLVKVGEEGRETEHRVRVPDGYQAELGLDDVDVAALIEESFHFLLGREPRESILRNFELPVIARYFPDYPDEIRRRLSPV